MIFGRSAASDATATEVHNQSTAKERMAAEGHARRDLRHSGLGIPIDSIGFAVLQMEGNERVVARTWAALDMVKGFDVEDVGRGEEGGMRSLFSEPEGECIGVRSHGDCKKMRIFRAQVDSVVEFSGRLPRHEVQVF